MLKKETTTPIENRATDMMKMLTDTRKQVEALEKGMVILQNNQSTLMKQYLDQQKRLDEEKPDSVVTNVTDRLTALENASISQYDILREIAAGNADLKSRMEDVEGTIGASRLATTRIDVDDATEIK